MVYVSIQNGEGRAIVKGSRPYVVEFTYQEGQIGNLTCECFCTSPCKHQAAVLLQVKETLTFLEKFPPSNYFATLTKELFAEILLNPHKGVIRLG